tara:strand:+ start:315 stop:986 length:672 start_codon:yes stop_codon:yes gene_type:complete
MKYPILILGASSAIGNAINNNLKKKGMSTITLGRADSNDLIFDISKKTHINLSTKISGFVNCIGVNKNSFQKLNHFDRDSEIIKVNLINVLLFFYSIENKFVENSSVVHIGSLANQMLFKDDAAYMISKTGLSGMSKAIAARLSVIKGRSNIINPSYVRTPMTENSFGNDIEREKRNSRHLRKKWANVEDISDIVHFLLSSKSKFINCEEINIDDGWTINSLL